MLQPFQFHKTWIALTLLFFKSLKWKDVIVVEVMEDMKSYRVMWLRSRGEQGDDQDYVGADFKH